MESPAIPNVVVNCISCWETINYQAKEKARTQWLGPRLLRQSAVEL